MAHEYLELENINTSNNGPIHANLKYTGTNFLTNQSNLWLFKFTLNGTSQIPKYIPKLVDTYNPFVSSSLQIMDANTSNYMMDWGIAVEYSNGVKKEGPVYWEKEGFQQPRANYPQSSYFWIENTDEICTMVTNAFNRILGSSNDIIFVKNADRWSLLVNSELDIKAIYFNEEMMRYFSFNYALNGKITLLKIQTYNILDTVYYQMTTPFSNKKLFPFDKLIFKSELDVPFLKLQSANSNIINYSSNVLLSYDLLVSDLSNIGTSISFISDCKDGSISLMSQVLPPTFTISPYLVMKSGEVWPLNIGKDEKLSLTLMFF